MKIINNEMRDRAEAFILRWRGTMAERAEAQTFTNEFFQIFGLDRKNLAQFEKPIQKKNETGTGFADLFWTGKLIIESKSAHLDNPKNWEKTLAQAEDYINNLLPHQKPQYIMLMNFKRIQKYDVTVTKSEKVKIKFLTEVPLEQLDKRLDEFNFFIEFANRLESDEEKVNQEAARRIANVYDAIERKGYSSTDISVLLARILFCLFAEDTGIFERKQFENYIRENTSGKTLGDHLLALFETLDTPVKTRGKLNPALSKFPYVNGGLFDSSLKKVPHTTNALRDALLECCAYDWSDISPVIFGSLFQALMNNVERRNLGAHFTSEKNILRVIKPLFLDELHLEFDNIKSSKKSLESFRKKIGSLVFLDPACGCGNFLVVIYRELMLLDIEVIKKMHRGDNKLITDGSLLSSIHLNNFYGYEIEPTSNMIASVAMWLTQHQMHLRLESEFGQIVPTIPLEESAIIKNCNALLTEWEGREIQKNLVEKVTVEFNYIVGNPPFIGKHLQSKEQKSDVEQVFQGVQGSGNLDYVSCWYAKASEYLITHPKTRIGLVSTNSICQGEQTSTLWSLLFNKYNVKIQFAHQTFKWSNEAKGIAAVYCIIIGFGIQDISEKYIYEYKDIKGEPTKRKVKNINSYLVDAKNIVITNRSKPICNVPPMMYGSKIVDDGNLLMTDEEKKEFLKTEPNARKFIKPILSGDEFINGKKRWCIWLKDASPNEIKTLPKVMERVKKVKAFRLQSKKAQTVNSASTPTLFAEIRQPNSNFLLIPRTSSENRAYIPFGFFSKNYIVSDSCTALPNATLYIFGILTSHMHMTWVRFTCGRLESRFRYSNTIVYNNFPFPKEPNAKNKKQVEVCAQKILDIRDSYFAKGNSLSDLYDPNTMPSDLIKAHEGLNNAVDKCYRDSSFTSETKRMEFLLNRYEEYTANLFTEVKKVQRKSTEK
jgi:hypothetical protein